MKLPKRIPEKIRKDMQKDFPEIILEDNIIKKKRSLKSLPCINFSDCGNYRYPGLTSCFSCYVKGKGEKVKYYDPKRYLRQKLKGRSTTIS